MEWFEKLDKAIAENLPDLHMEHDADMRRTLPPIFSDV